MANIIPIKTLIFLILVLFLSVTVRSVVLINDDRGLISRGIPQNEDALAVIYGTMNLDRNGEFAQNIIHDGYHPSLYAVSPPPYYPIAQIILFNLNVFTRNEPYEYLTFISIFLATLLSLFAFILVRIIYKNDSFALFSAFLTATITVVARDVVWSTIHTLQGYLMLLLILFGIWKYDKTKKRKWIVFIFFMFISLSYIHLLSFVIIFLSLCVYGIYEIIKIRNIKYFALFIGIFLFIYWVFITISSFSMGFGGKPYTFAGSILELLYQYNNPTPVWLWLSQPIPINNAPVVLGYTLTILGICGMIASLQTREFRFNILVIILFLIPFLIANLHYVGLYYINFRFLFFCWIPLVVAAPAGFKLFLKFIEKIRLKRIIVMFFVSSLVMASIIHSINYEISAQHSSPWANYSFPPDEHLEAMYWIKENTHKNATILLYIDSPHYYLKWMPILSERLVTFGALPPESINLENETMISRIVAPFVDDDLKNRKNLSISRDQKRRENPITMLTYPDNEGSKKLMDEYIIKYIYLWEGTQFENKYKNSKNFKKIYEKNGVKIYERL